MCYVKSVKVIRFIILEFSNQIAALHVSFFVSFVRQPLACRLLRRINIICRRNRSPTFGDEVTPTRKRCGKAIDKIKPEIYEATCLGERVRQRIKCESPEKERINLNICARKTRRARILQRLGDGLFLLQKPELWPHNFKAQPARTNPF